MIKRFIIIVFGSYFVLTGLSFGQGGKIQGPVILEDGTPLPGVMVSIKGTSISTTTDRNGVYAVSGITRGLVTLIATLDGFKEAIKEVVVSPAMTMVVDITLEMAPLAEETVVEAERPLLSVAEEVSEVKLTPKQIETLPSLGERDIFRAFQLLPGISGSQESSSGLYIRGGTPDQNLILYDGFTIYQVDHLFGYFSAFNMEALRGGPFEQRRIRVQIRWRALQHHGADRQAW
jgi:ferric enterobactin receptor